MGIADLKATGYIRAALSQATVERTVTFRCVSQSSKLNELNMKSTDRSRRPTLANHLLATSKGRKAIHPPASGPRVPLEGLLERDVELSGSLLVYGV